MHWSQRRALTAIAQQGHQRLDLELNDALHRDMRHTAVCSKPGCPELAPCPTHSRPKNAPWSKDRDPKSQAAFRKRVLEWAGHRCQRCGAEGVELQAHHTQGDNGMALCRPCHKIVDVHAR